MDNKLVEIELNTPRTFRSGYNSSRIHENEMFSFTSQSLIETNAKYLSLNEINDIQLTNRSALLTNRTNKSVRFDDEDKSDKNDENKIDYLLNKAVNQRYKNLIDLVNLSKNGFQSSNNNNEDINLFSLSLPLTPRSIDGVSLVEQTIDTSRSNITSISKLSSKSLESIYDKINMDFIKE